MLNYFIGLGVEIVLWLQGIYSAIPDTDVVTLKDLPGGVRGCHYVLKKVGGGRLGWLVVVVVVVDEGGARPPGGSPPSPKPPTPQPPDPLGSLGLGSGWVLPRLLPPPPA